MTCPPWRWIPGSRRIHNSSEAYLQWLTIVWTQSTYRGRSVYKSSTVTAINIRRCEVHILRNLLHNWSTFTMISIPMIDANLYQRWKLTLPWDRIEVEDYCTVEVHWRSKPTILEAAYGHCDECSEHICYGQSKSTYCILHSTWTLYSWRTWREATQLSSHQLPGYQHLHGVQTALVTWNAITTGLHHHISSGMLGKMTAWDIWNLTNLCLHSLQ